MTHIPVAATNCISCHATTGWKPTKWNHTQVVVTAKNARERGDNAQARDEAANLCQIVVESLLGYHLGGGRYLRLGDAPGPEYDAGYCQVPIAFRTAATFKGTLTS